MKIIFRKDFENYRIAIGKLTFLESYRDYRLVENIDYFNVMLMENRKKQKFYVSILRKPDVKKTSPYPLRIFYQNMQYGKNKSDVERKYSKEYEKVRVEKLSKEFDNKFNMNFRMGFTDPDELLDKKYGVDLLDKYFFDADDLRKLKEEPDLFKDNKDFKKLADTILKYEEGSPLLYKYFEKNTVVRNMHGVNGGNLAFSHPKYFNDPFDCNCYLSNANTLMDRFRVLCMTSIYNNILMWSHYAENHKGYCYGYSFYAIVEQILEMKYKGLCVMGLVSYKDKRPKQTSTSNSFSYSELKFYINATFTKFRDWQYEKEFRFVLIFGDDVEEDSRDVDDFKVIGATIRDRYKGLKGDGSCRYEEVLKKPISGPVGEAKLIQKCKSKVDKAAKLIKKDGADYKLW